MDLQQLEKPFQLLIILSHREIPFGIAISPADSVCGEINLALEQIIFSGNGKIVFI